MGCSKLEPVQDDVVSVAMIESVNPCSPSPSQIHSPPLITCFCCCEGVPGLMVVFCVPTPPKATVPTTTKTVWAEGYIPSPPWHLWAYGVGKVFLNDQSDLCGWSRNDDVPFSKRIKWCRYLMWTPPMHICGIPLGEENMHVFRFYPFPFFFLKV